jgi:ribosomal protein uL24
MKSDTERKKYYKAKNHQKTRRMHVHLSRALRGSIKQKKRSILVHKGDKVRIMRGPGKGKEARVARVSHAKMKVYVDGVNARTAKGREVLVALQPSNLELVTLEQTKERKELFAESAFKKEEKKPAPKPEKMKGVKVEKPTVEAEVVEEKKEVKSEAPKPAAPKPKTTGQKPETAKPETEDPKPETGNRKPETEKR